MKIPPAGKAGKSYRTSCGGGLYLQIGGSGSASSSWLLRYQRNGKETWMGLGPKSVFTLKQARGRAIAEKKKIYDGIDPLQAKRDQRRQEALEASRSITFRKAAEEYYALHERKWTSHKHAKAFLSTLKMFAFPVIGDWPIADVDTAAVLRIIEPIWIEKTQTASRVRGRIEAVLGWATVRGFRAGDNPARWTNYLSETLPAGRKVSPIVHHKALPYPELPAFVQQLGQHKGIGPMALEFIVLSVCRTSEVLKARWSEFDFDKKIWTVPAERMKGRKSHAVPLTGRMLKLLKSLPREGGDDSLVFIGAKAGKPLGKMTLPKLIDAMGHDVTVHGFRASFRTWAGEMTSFPREAIEFSLAHVVGTDSEQAYWRGDMIERRRKLMEAWSTFVGSPPVRKSGSVTPIRRAGV
jgi:integrase